MPSLASIPVYGTNPLPITGGADRQRDADLFAQARRAIARRQALLTNQELERAALQLPGFAVARAEVLARFDSRLPERSIPGVRTLVVIPHRTTGHAVTPTSAAYVAAVQRQLEPQRVLGERLIVSGPRYARLDIALVVIVEPGARFDDVRREIEGRLAARFSDLPRRDDVEPWPLGRRATCGEVEALSAAAPGVQAVTSCRIARSGGELGSADVALARDEVAIATAVRIEPHAERAASEG